MGIGSLRQSGNNRWNKWFPSSINGYYHMTFNGYNDALRKMKFKLLFSPCINGWIPKGPTNSNPIFLKFLVDCQDRCLKGYPRITAPWAPIEAN